MNLEKLYCNVQRFDKTAFTMYLDRVTEYDEWIRSGADLEMKKGGLEKSQNSNTYQKNVIHKRNR